MLEKKSLPGLSLMLLLLTLLMPSSAFAASSVTWQNLSYSNCATQVVNGNTVFVNVSLTQLNLSGIFCSVSDNYPWFTVLLLLVVYISIAFIFSYLNNLRLLVIVSAGGMVFASILWMYGLLAPGVWIESMMFLIFSIILMYLASR